MKAEKLRFLATFLSVGDDGHDEEDGADELRAADHARHRLRVHRVHREQHRGDLGHRPEW